MFDAMDVDSGYVVSDDDTGADREYCRVKFCPLHEECSKNSWDKVTSWSYLGLEQVIANVREHLLNSDLHKYRWSHTTGTWKSTRSWKNVMSSS